MTQSFGKNRFGTSQKCVHWHKQWWHQLFSCYLGLVTSEQLEHKIIIDVWILEQSDLSKRLQIDHKSLIGASSLTGSILLFFLSCLMKGCSCLRISGVHHNLPVLRFDDLSRLRGATGLCRLLTNGWAMFSETAGLCLRRQSRCILLQC